MKPYSEIWAIADDVQRQAQKLKNKVFKREPIFLSDIQDFETACRKATEDIYDANCTPDCEPLVREVKT